MVPDLEISPWCVCGGGGPGGEKGAVQDQGVRSAPLSHPNLHCLAWSLNICHRIGSGKFLPRNLHKMSPKLGQIKGSKMKDSTLQKHLAPLVSQTIQSLS